MKHHWFWSCAAFCLLSFVVRAGAQAWPIEMLAFDSARWLDRPWTWFSAPLLTPHFNLWAADLGCLLLLGFWGSGALQAGRVDALCLWLSWPLSALGLLLWPQPLADASGLSAITHAAGAILLVRLSALKSLPWVSALSVGAFAFKLGLEHAWLTPKAFSADWGSVFWPILHLSGAICGLLTAQIALPFRRDLPQPERMA